MSGKNANQGDKNITEVAPTNHILRFLRENSPMNERSLYINENVRSEKPNPITFNSTEATFIYTTNNVL